MSDHRWVSFYFCTLYKSVCFKFKKRNTLGLSLHCSIFSSEACRWLFEVGHHDGSQLGIQHHLRTQKHNSMNMNGLPYNISNVQHYNNDSSSSCCFVLTVVGLRFITQTCTTELRLLANQTLTVWSSLN